MANGLRKVSFTVEHPGDHAASPQAVAGGLRSALHAESLKRDGDYTVLESVNVSGSHTDFTVQVATQPVEDSGKPKGE